MVVHWQFLNFSAILLLMAFVATVATVPTSVLVQNSELATTANVNGNGNNNNNNNANINNNNNNNNNAKYENGNANYKNFVNMNNMLLKSNSNNVNNANNNPNNQNNNNLLAKVKRSSNNLSMKEQIYNGMPNPISSLNNVPPNTALDKKSSPEVVPASFNAPMSQAVQQHQQQFPQSQSIETEMVTPVAAVISMPPNEDLFNTAIAAGLTAAAVEAAAAASQRELEQQQQLQKQQQQQQQQQQQSQFYNDDFYVDDVPPLMHKRGIPSQQYLYGTGVGAVANGVGIGYGGVGYDNGYINTDYYSNNNNPYLNTVPVAGGMSSVGSMNSMGQSSNLAGVPNGMWTDELDPSIVYTDLQDIDDYVPAPRVPSYRGKAYDNLQNLLNSETYMEPVVFPVQYSNPNRYYGTLVDVERNKRANMNKINKYADMRLKRDTNLTPADMLALVALVEAGERARKDTDEENANGFMSYPAADTYNNGKMYYGNANMNNYDYPAAVEDVDYGMPNSWLEPAVVDYYGVPVNVETMPKYEMSAPRSATGNRYSTKRYMVAKKKKRSIVKSNLNANGNPEKYF